MARAFARCGPMVNCVDQGNYLPMPHSRRLFVRGIYRLLYPLFLRQYNDRVAAELRLFRPHLMVVYKGMSLEPRSLLLARELGVTCCNIYPDVSAFTHGPHIPRCIPLYDHVFTTKSFGARDFQQHFNVNSISYLPHGYDPELHRPMHVTPELQQQFGADASFIGTWSPKKETYLAAVAANANSFKFKIWGAQWEKCNTAALRPHIVGRDIMGTLYPVAIQTSRINIAILSEAWTGSSSGDQTTSRTFHIPASGGFMLHERTEELSHFYEEGKEVVCFSSPDELAKKVRFYLEHESDRERIRCAGHQRCVSENAMDARAGRILEFHKARASRS
jgi:glycosyltransferase involved in cell wall biosynthesis